MSNESQIQKARGDEVEYTSLQGRMSGVSFEELVDAFGEPHWSGDKSKACWELIVDGTVVTIYDWKRYDTPVEKITRWNIGGESRKAPETLSRAFPHWNIRSR